MLVTFQSPIGSGSCSLPLVTGANIVNYEATNAVSGTRLLAFNAGAGSGSIQRDYGIGISAGSSWMSTARVTGETGTASGTYCMWFMGITGNESACVPYSVTNNDGQFGASIGTSDQWFSFVRDAFDMLYREGATQPKMMSIGLHMRLIGHPARAVGLQRLLDHIQKRDGVWVTRRLDIARHWIKTHPYPGKGLNE